VRHEGAALILQREKLFAMLRIDRLGNVAATNRLTTFTGDVECEAKRLE
jgi:hypothetical protein